MIFTKTGNAKKRCLTCFILNFYRKRCSVFLVALYTNFAVHAFGDSLGNGQPQAVSLSGAAFFCAVKAVENMLCVLF